MPALAPHKTHQPVVIVELFTSEGCSSCPPADDLLRRINETHTDQGQLIVGISEHVTYWNSLGWSDPFSSQAYTERQNAYGSHFHLDSVYTPQMVVNGQQQLVGSDRAALRNALQITQASPGNIELNITQAAVEASSLNVTFSADALGSHPGVDIFAVLTEDEVHSNVRRGENAGRVLTHVAVARSITRLGPLASAVDNKVSIPLPASLVPSRARHIILFAQAREAGRILGADAAAF